MARTRNLKPSFFLNEQLAALPALTRILFGGLWCHADREGRLEDRPRKLKAEILPYDDHDVDAALKDLHEAGFILRYRNGTCAYIQVLTFLSHQNPHHREPQSMIPAPDMPGSSTGLAPGQPQSSPGPARLDPNHGILTTNHGVPSPSNNLLNNTSSRLHLPPEDKSVPAATRAGARARGRANGSRANGAKGTETWAAYAQAYEGRWGVQPARNAGVNSRIARLVDKLGAEEAPQVAAFFLTHNRAVYVGSKHCTELLLRDAEGLHTEWLTNNKITTTQANSVDRLQTSLDVVERVAKRIGAK